MIEKIKESGTTIALTLYGLRRNCLARVSTSLGHV